VAAEILRGRRGKRARSDTSSYVNYLVCTDYALRALLRSLFGLTRTLDLHGLGVKEAVVETEQFLREARAAGETQVRIIYGKGRRTPGGVGVLRAVIPLWLDEEGRDLGERYERDLDPSGDDGAVRVWLRPRTSLPSPADS
jgi:DNA-nicking Smr family endonuclease